MFKFDAITELPTDFETFFVNLSRRKSQNIQEYSAEFERALRKLQRLYYSDTKSTYLTKLSD